VAVDDVRRGSADVVGGALNARNHAIAEACGELMFVGICLTYAAPE
jgi:hypothetical protein